MKRGTKVMVRKTLVEWFLNNPNIYARPDGTMDEYYERETLVHLALMLGAPLKATVLERSPSNPSTYLVKLDVGDGLSCSYYIHKKNLKKAR